MKKWWLVLVSVVAVCFGCVFAGCARSDSVKPRVKHPLENIDERDDVSGPKVTPIIGDIPFEVQEATVDEFYSRCMQGAEKKTEASLGRGERSKKSLYLKSCGKDFDLHGFDSLFSDPNIVEVVVGNNSRCVRKVLDRIGKKDVLMDLSFLSAETLIRALRDLPSELSALRIDGWGHNDSEEIKKKVNQELGRFVELDYLRVKIVGGSVEFLSKTRRLRCFDAEISEVNSESVRNVLASERDSSLQHLKMRWDGVGNAVDFMKIMKKLSTIDVTQYGYVTELSELKDLEKLESFRGNSIGESLPLESWPKMNELIVWESHVADRVASVFRKKRGSEMVLVLNNQDKIDYLFGSATRIRFEDALAGKSGRQLYKVLEKRDEIEGLHKLIEAKQKASNMSLMCRGGVVAQIETKNKQKETVYIFAFGSVMKWKGWGDIELTESSRLKVKNWMIENGIVTDVDC